MKYKVFVDDNFHYMDESERYQLGGRDGGFDTCEEAIAACKKIVDESLPSGPTDKPAKEVLEKYRMFGEDPYIISDDGDCHFSAWSYAEERCAELCPPEPQEEYTESSEPYLLTDRDKTIVSCVIHLLQKIAEAEFTKPAQTVTVEKAIGILRQMPSPPSGQTAIYISLNGPSPRPPRLIHRKIKHHWSVEIRRQSIEVFSYDVPLHQPTKKYAFGTLRWVGSPGELSYFSNNFGDKPTADCWPLQWEVDDLDLARGGFELHVSDN